MDTGDSPALRAADTTGAPDAFVAELIRWRIERGFSKKQLALAMGFDPSYVSHVEAHRHRPTEDFARRAEMVLQAGGAIWGRDKEYEELRSTTRSRAADSGRDSGLPQQWLGPGAGLVVEHEIAELSYVDGEYRCRTRRVLYNAGTEPVSRYLIRIAVDRYPGQPELSNQHYPDHPLTWDELRLNASLSGEPMLWRPKADRDAFKEVWLLFESGQGRFPLYPGQRAHLEYTFRVGADKWGQWFQRAVRLPTRRLTVRLDLPVALGPVVWGMETSLSAEGVPLGTPIVQEIEADRAIFSWSTDAPRLHARYRLEWRYRSSDGMRAMGVVQRGAEILGTPARSFVLPREEPMAREVVARLGAALDEIGAAHAFVKGYGLAAPQLDLGWAAAVVRPAPPEPPIVLLNPRVVGSSAEVDEQYEGCLSFFDVRGSVGRPLWIDVETAQFHGERVVRRYERAVARLVAHEIDHLGGVLYVDRMPPGAQPVPVGEAPGLGLPWRY